MAISTNGVVLTRLAGALYNQQLSNATYNEVLTGFNSAAALNTLANYLISTDFASKTDLQIATTLVTNLGLSSITGLDNWVSAQLTAAGTGNKGSKIISLLNDFSNMSTTDATYGAAVTAFNSKIDAAQALSQTSGNSGGTFVSAGSTGGTFTMTTSFDNLKLTTVNDAISGVYGDGVAANTTYTVGDAIVDSSTADNDTLTLLVTGTTGAGVATITNVENIVLNNTASGANTFNSALVTGAKNIKANVTIAGDTQTVSNLASLSTIVELAGKGNLTATTSATLTGTSDVVSAKLSGAGTSTAARSTLDIGNTNAIEGVTVATSGTNFVTLTTGTANKSVTVTGDGVNNFNTLSGDATSSVLTFDASAATGKQTATFGAGAITVKGGTADDTFAFGSTLGATDTVDGGSGNDTTTFTVATAVLVNPTLASVETVTADFTAAGTYNASKTTGLATLNVTNSTGSVNVSATNLPSTATALNFKDGATHGTADLSYATGANAAAVLTIGGQNTTTATSAANTLGNSTIAGASSVTINSVRDADNTTSVTNTVGTLSLGTATTLTANTASLAALTLGNLTATSLTKLTVNADGGAYQQGTLAGGAMTDLSLTSANKAGLTTGAIGAANSATTASKLVNYSVTTGATTSVSLAAIDAATLSTTSAAAASALKTISYNLGSAATITGIGAVDASDENGAGTNKGSGVAQLDSVAFTLGADAVTNGFAVGAISARSVTAATYTIAAQTSAHTSGATLNIDESIGTATVNAGTNETFTLTIEGLDDNAGTDLYSLALGSVTATGAGNVVVAGLSTGLKSISSIDFSGLTGTSQLAASILSGSAGANITIGSGGTTNTGVSGSDKADIITGGKGADVILGGSGADTITSGLGADTVTGGAGQDTIDLTESTSAVDKVYYAHSGTANVDSVTGFKAGTDIVQYTIGNIDGSGTNAFATAVGADVNAAGAGSSATVAVNTSVAIADAVNLVFFSNTAATSFATAIGTAAITNATTGWGNVDNTTVNAVAAVYFDSLNGQAVFGFLQDSTTTGTALTTADTFVEVTRVGIAVADYTAANIAASFAFAS